MITEADAVPARRHVVAWVAAVLAGFTVVMLGWAGPRLYNLAFRPVPAQVLKAEPPAQPAAGFTFEISQVVRPRQRAGFLQMRERCKWTTAARITNPTNTTRPSLVRAVLRVSSLEYKDLASQANVDVPPLDHVAVSYRFDLPCVSVPTTLELIAADGGVTTYVLAR